MIVLPFCGYGTLTPVKYKLKRKIIWGYRPGIVQSNLCWKIHNKYVFRVNIHIYVLKYLVHIQIIQNQLKISEGGKGTTI